MPYALLVAIAVCLNQQQVDDKICQVLCIKNFASGFSRNKKCYCVTDMGLIDDFSRGQIKVLRVNSPPQDQPIAVKVEY